jgi:hypothetical protein
MRTQRMVFALVLSLGLLLALFVAGVVAPSVLYSTRAANLVSPLASTRTLDIVGVTLVFNFWNIGFAFLGALFGSVVVLIVTPSSASSTVAWGSVYAHRHCGVESSNPRKVSRYNNLWRLYDPSSDRCA